MTGFLPPHVGPVLFCSVLFVYLVLCCWQPDVLEILEQIWMLTLLYLPRPAVWSLDWLSSVSLRFLHKTEPFDVFLRGYNPGHTSQSPEAPTLQLGFPWPHPACPTRNGITPSWWAPLMWSSIFDTSWSINATIRAVFFSGTVILTNFEACSYARRVLCCLSYVISLTF